ncbi:MAG: hypothetical protein L6R41_007900 [Letrouitia leprolyta]|nr:MAG: hypothetical protein L6R41_007900 [Letrouitia leprolyta]
MARRSPVQSTVEDVLGLYLAPEEPAWGAINIRRSRVAGVPTEAGLRQRAKAVRAQKRMQAKKTNQAVPSDDEAVAQMSMTRNDNHDTPQPAPRTQILEFTSSVQSSSGVAHNIQAHKKVMARKRTRADFDPECSAPSAERPQKLRKPTGTRKIMAQHYGTKLS